MNIEQYDKKIFEYSPTLCTSHTFRKMSLTVKTNFSQKESSIVYNFVEQYYDIMNLRRDQVCSVPDDYEISDKDILNTKL